MSSRFSESPDDFVKLLRPKSDMHWLRLFSSALCSIVSLLVSTSSALAADPDIVWESIETEHFHIIYDSRHKELGALYATYAEQAFVATAPAFGEWPRKTTLVIDDSGDMANGLATGLPYSQIISYPVLPSTLDSIGDYGNWGLELITHEYVHILTFEPASGFVRPLRWIFGTIVRPNGLLPRWYLEGLAVELETRYSSFGRLRSANYLSIMRAMIEEQTLRKEDVARINEAGIPDWPGGVRPYLMGALLWNELTRKGGDKIIGELNQTYSRRIPFLIDGPVESRFGLDYQGILDKTYESLESRSREQVKTIDAAGATKSKRLEQKGNFNHSPVVSPDGKNLVFIARTHNEDGLIMRVERADAKSSFAAGKAKRLTQGDSASRLSWSPDSKSLVFDAIDVFDRFYQYFDLWRYDLDTRKKRQLTKGLRAREPAWSVDGSWIVFSQNMPGSTQLAAVDAEGKNYRALYTPPIQTRIARPEALSANEVVFTEKRDDGSEVLKVLTLDFDSAKMPVAKGEPRRVLESFKPAHFPRRTKDGLVFVSDKSGVANIYLANADLSHAHPISNVKTRAMTPEIDDVTGDLIFSRLTADGPVIEITAKADWSPSANPPQVAPLVEGDWPTFTPPTVDVQIEREEYNPFPYLVPRYWMPYAFIIPDGLFMQASTATSDPVGRHAYGIATAYDTLTQKPSVFGQYTNRTTRVPITIAGDNIYDWLYGSQVARNTLSGSIFATTFLPGLSNQWRATLGWQSVSTSFLNVELSRGGPQVSFLYSNAAQRGLEISPETGGSFRLAYMQYLPGLGTLEYEQGEANLSYFVSGRTASWLDSFLPERHVLALFANASIAPRLRNVFLGRTTIGGNFPNGLIQNTFLMRGYGTGVFLGRNMITSTAEYRFPLSYPYSGWGTKPIFFNRLHGTLFVDAVTLDGRAYDAIDGRFSTTYVGKPFWSTGLEVKVDTTLFYHMPFQLILGLYYGMDQRANPFGLFPFIGFGL